MKDLLIISIYDSGYGFSIMFNGEIIERTGVDEETNLADVFESKYNDYHFHEWLKEKYPDKKIIICENGDIEVL